MSKPADSLAVDLLGWFFKVEDLKSRLQGLAELSFRERHARIKLLLDDADALLTLPGELASLTAALAGRIVVRFPGIIVQPMVNLATMMEAIDLYHLDIERFRRAFASARLTTEVAKSAIKESARAAPPSMPEAPASPAAHKATLMSNRPPARGFQGSLVDYARHVQQAAWTLQPSTETSTEERASGPAASGFDPSEGEDQTPEAAGPPAGGHIMSDDPRPYRRLDRRTGSFRLAECPPEHRFVGISEPPRYSSREFLCRTPQGVWIWWMESVGPVALPGDPIPYQQVSLDKAAEWFSENHQALPEILIDDRDRRDAAHLVSHPEAPASPDPTPRGDGVDPAPASGIVTPLTGNPLAGVVDPVFECADLLDETVIADALVSEGFTLEAAFVRHFKGRQKTTYQEIVQAVCPGEERDWATVKTWVNRVKNALLDLRPPCRLSFRTTQRGSFVIKESPPE